MSISKLLLNTLCSISMCITYGSLGIPRSYAITLIIKKEDQGY
ncbi:hypothetical protein APHWI1_0724 [Anaplasma phagocytophilum str. ApWI1]|uniref:Uncharacterized protein n=1 Tax=Anaplasma phagocytophilum str. ApWI1 TaxID=1359155 RepID=A0A0F3PVL8_ANAPH|nr:hypothetical protein APHWEB_0793 [Anaplasma phagocytophilum str. Webster]KJV82745.1 hypothetical protein APHHGE2_1518 [Anaplasma phagocytophilum str. HGE2]KJV84425.1 hypothetical protein APHWI1_0724 [Anaplasma phagocytophilum str. ApWI1]KJV87293.1 hypothetical protein APHNYW_1233 [Anaplasma phagocytophilum str. ApNYW]KJV98114.1 hypothetical protein OTSANNIE_1497 [Anaplasma phagocytophilum str. Annie]